MRVLVSDTSVLIGCLSTTQREQSICAKGWEPSETIPGAGCQELKSQNGSELTPAPDRLPSLNAFALPDEGTGNLPPGVAPAPAPIWRRYRCAASPVRGPPIGGCSSRSFPGYGQPAGPLCCRARTLRSSAASGFTRRYGRLDPRIWRVQRHCWNKPLRSKRGEVVTKQHYAHNDFADAVTETILRQWSWRRWNGSSESTIANCMNRSVA